METNLTQKFNLCAMADLVYIDKQNLAANTDKDFEFAYISLSDVDKGKISNRLETYSFVNAPSRARRVVKPGDILLATVRPNLESFAMVTEDHEGCVASTGFAVISPKHGVCGSYIYHYLFSFHINNQIKSLVVGSNYPAINSSDVKSLSIYVPEYKVQKKIAQILSTWDNAILATERLLENSQQRKKALMQQLLTGKKRLPGFEGEWEIGSLKDIALISKGKALSSKDLIEGDYPVIAGGKTSPYSHREFTHENVITVSASGAYAGYVAFHPYKFWASDCSVVEAKKFSDINFIYYFMVWKQSRIYSLQSGGAQPHIYPKDLHVLHIHIPTKDEQQAIANVLTTADQEIDALQKRLDHLKQEKKALMQQLLTGKRRVQVDDAA